MIHCAKINGVMSVSENYIPQTENLQHFNSIVEELQSITNENTTLKNNIVTKIDLLIKQLNKDGKSGDDDIIKTLNRFISGFSGEVKVKSEDEDEDDETAARKNGDNEDDEKAVLLAQNQKLRSILQSKINYNTQIEQLNKEYSTEIDTIMNQIHERKYQIDHSRIQQYKEIQLSLYNLQQQEFQKYFEFIQNQETLHKLGQTVIQILQTIGKGYDEEVELNKLLHSLDLYRSADLKNGDESYRKYNIEKLKNARKFKSSYGDLGINGNIKNGGVDNDGSRIGYNKRSSNGFEVLNSTNSLSEGNWPGLS